MSDVSRSPRRRWLTLLLVLIVFVSGVVVGGGVAALFIARRAQQAIQNPAVQVDRVADRLRRRLDLRPDQAAQVRAILVRRQEALLRIRADAQPRVRDELLAARDEVSAVLDASQRPRWDVLFDDLAKRWMPTTQPVAP